MDRAHRIGQKKVVSVYRLITRGTLEEKIMGLQRFKLNIASSVITQQNSGLASMGTAEVLDLFHLSSDEEEAAAAKLAGAASGGKKGVLEGMTDDDGGEGEESEYADFEVSKFISGMK